MASLQPSSADAVVVESMRDYYARRAAVYERVYFKPERQADLRAMEKWLTPQFSGRRVLEIACGTGWWTPHGARDCVSWLATDLNPETMAIAQRKRLPAGKVDFARVDAYTLAEITERAFDGATSGGAASFDAAFAGCWWSHVPLSRLPGWLDLLHAKLEPGARVVFLDNAFVPTSSTPLSRQDADGNTYQQRSLDDGSTHEVLKNFPTADQAFSMLGPRARDAQWTPFEHYWILAYRLA
jgi:SAM-dependent methyltransferase